MRIDSLKIGAHRYQVVEVETAELDDTARWAEIDRRRNHIRVQVWDRPGSAQVESLLHECIHAWCADAGTGFDGDDEERIATVLAPRMAAFFADNPEAVRAMLKALR